MGQIFLIIYYHLSFCSSLHLFKSTKNNVWLLWLKLPFPLIYLLNGIQKYVKILVNMHNPQGVYI